MIRHTPSSSQHHHHHHHVSSTSTTSTSNNSSEFILLDNDISSTVPVSLTLASDHRPHTAVAHSSPKSNFVLHRSSPYSSTLTHHFDTFALVERLETEGGFTRTQARFLMEIMQQQIRSR